MGVLINCAVHLVPITSAGPGHTYGQLRCARTVTAVHREVSGPDRRTDCPQSASPGHSPITRRRVLKRTAMAAPTPLLLASGVGLGAGDAPTPAQTEGPYFSPVSPERTNLADPDSSGTRLAVVGYPSTRAIACRWPTAMDTSMPIRDGENDGLTCAQASSMVHRWPTVASPV